jgi:hypothetical protein
VSATEIDWHRVADVACLECMAGKHQNCDGTSLDTASGTLRICPCDDDGHAR